jgi:hypothetical protein
MTMAMAMTMTTAAGCEPEGVAVDDPLVINDTACETGSLSASFSGLTVGVPVDRPVRVQDGARAAIDVDVRLSDDADPAFSLLRAPFVVNDAMVVPLRVQLTSTGTVTGTLELAPETASPCRLSLRASDGRIDDDTPP